MSIEQFQDGRWFVDVEPIKGKRFRRRFKTKAEALRFESLVRQRLVQDTEWNPKPKDKRRLSELIDRWFDLHGHTLSDGVRRKEILLPSPIPNQSAPAPFPSAPSWRRS